MFMFSQRPLTNAPPISGTSKSQLDDDRLTAYSYAQTSGLDIYPTEATLYQGVIIKDHYSMLPCPP